MLTTNGFGALVAESGICFGGDYNPEQWPREVWREDARLMRQAGVKDAAGVEPTLPGLAGLNAGRAQGDEVEAVRRGDVLFLLNHSGEPAHTALQGTWTDLLTGTTLSDEVTVGPTDAVALLPADVGH